MNFSHSFHALRIDIERYRSELDRHMREAVAQAVSVWLDAVLLEIPSWSGASRATFIKLAMAIGQNIDASPVSANWSHGLFTSRLDRRSVGQSQSTGKVECDKAKGRYVFIYGTTLPWLIWNEYHNANLEPDPTLFYRVIKEGPYNFQAKGSDAFKRFADRVRLPPVASCLRSHPVR